ncbi:contractile injection system tape measure protein [Aquimarina rubra]|uniref:Contractile injection system tape measure protein n=1 Tax=Aquimarina rubra TaxID=1920033 RepID=A0ABW5LMA6_9FLAO
MIQQKHIINKVFFEVNTSDTKTAYDLKDNLDMFLKQNLLPTIQAYFDSLTSVKDQIFRFDKLELSIDSTDVKDQVQLQLDIIKSLQKQVSLKKEPKTFEEKDATFLITDKEKSDVETFLYFLKSGQNPWWDSTKDIEDTKFLETVISNKNFRVKLEESLHRTEVRKRLIYQFSDEILIKIFTKDQPVLRFPKILKRKAVRENYWEILLKYITDRNNKSLQEGLVLVFTKLKKNLLVEKIVDEVVSEKETRIAELQKINRLQKTAKQQELLQLKDSLIKSLMKLVSKQLKLTQKITISEQIVYNDLTKELKTQFDPEILEELIKVSVDRFYKILQKEFHKFQEKVLPFASELISEKLDHFRYNDIEISDRLIEKFKYHKLKEDQKLETEFHIYIQNSGLLLLHPYLGRLFSELKLLNDQGKIKPEKVELAIHLLHFLATKREKESESNLVFEKFLCGHPLDKPIRKNVRLPQKYKEEAESLLLAVLKNWEALKNTSPDGLRENFIKRAGKLMFDDPSKYRVIVERKTQDILLEKLPWNLTIIKLPWIDRLLFVEW